jgi:polar amino acid transport system permease protein
MSTEHSAALDGPRPASRLAPAIGRMSDWPWWLLVATFIGLYIVLRIVTDAQTNVIFRAISQGLQVTVTVTIGAYALAVVIGLIVGLARVSSNRIIFNLAAFYVEVVRGIPILVLLMYIAFVGVPLMVSGLNAFGNWLLETFGWNTWFAVVATRDIDQTVRVIIGLGVAYGAFEAEIFRAGIQSIEKGQMEAARSMGMSYFQAMRYVIVPQAVRRVLPALGNDFVAMVKDSSLVSVLGVRDLTQLTKLYAASSFLFFQSYTILAFMYLVITIMLTRVVRHIEGRLTRFRL